MCILCLKDIMAAEFAGQPTEGFHQPIIKPERIPAMVERIIIMAQ